MEFVDVLDDSGKLTGKVVAKSEAHAKGLWHRATHVWLVNNRGELLIQKRASRKALWPDAWDVSVAGHISAGEDSVSTSIREVNEELGLNVCAKDLLYLFTIKTSNVVQNTYLENEFQDIYLVKKDVDVSKLVLQKEEVSEVKLVHFRQLKKDIASGKERFCPHLEEYARLFEYLKKAGFK